MALALDIPQSLNAIKTKLESNQTKSLFLFNTNNHLIAHSYMDSSIPIQC